MGDIIAIIDSYGDCVVEYEYDPWGVCTIVSDTSNCNLGTKNPFRYRGYYYDNDTGLYYLQSRYYDPVTCKFINIDEPAILFETATSLQGTLLWDYCENNPVMNVDPTGEKAKFAVLTINQFYNESNEIIKILSKVLSSNSSKLYAYKNTWEFINNWNNLNGYDVIVINSHGDPKSITYMADYNINSKKMEKIKCKLLIILGCNSGHYDYKKSNPAYCFAKRINGVVIASDGTVYSSRSYGELVFNSIADNRYLGYCKKQTRPNKGWLIYQYLNSDITVKETMYKQLQFKALIAYLKLIKKLKGI